MSKYINMPDMAEEDFEILVAITTDLSRRFGTFRINLPNKAYVGNGEEPNMERFTFAGIDVIFEQKTKLAASGAATEQFELIMPSNHFQKKTHVGKMFGMELFADPECPKDRFIIREKNQLDI